MLYRCKYCKQKVEKLQIKIPQVCKECILTHFEHNKEKVINKAKKNVERKRKKELAELKEKVRNFKKEFQDKINLLVRLIDSNQPCICTGKQHKVFHAGHFY